MSSMWSGNHYKLVLHEHMKNVHVESGYGCWTCDNEFRSTKEYNVHADLMTGYDNE